MDEELGVKVTRLRRRLSVEADGAQSPATPSTPTKKRGTRLAKPALELIDENVTENVPKRTTRKSIARDAVEPVEEKAITPSRRSARIRSNTSLVHETTQAVVDSPRARRATRRNSQLGSDTETTTTPAKQRRTRKDSTSSVEKLAIANPIEKITVQVTEVIAEEPEKEIVKDSNDNQSPTLRKSPRLNKKGKKSIDEAVKDINKKQAENDKSPSDSSKLGETSPTANSSLNGPATEEAAFPTSINKPDKKVESKEYEKENLSVTSANLINELDTNPKRSSIFNKTASAIEELSNDKINRKRTKSWTTVTVNHSKEDGKSNNNVNNLGAGDSLLKKNEQIDIKSLNKSINKFNSTLENKENINILKSVDILDARDTIKLLEKSPSKDIQSVVFMEDSDSNSGGSVGKLTIDLQNDGEGQRYNGEDQCVPVVTQTTSKRSSPSESFTVEPMDIDETIPENVTINDYSDKANSSREEEKVPDSKRKSSISNQSSIGMNNSSSKSKRTSSISLHQEANNSKRKSSISTSEENNNDSKVGLNKSDRLSLSDGSQRKSSISMQDDIGVKLNANKSKKKTSLSRLESDNDKRKSSVTSQVEDNDDINDSANKSKRKSVSVTDSQKLEQTSNENKSTLVLSQLKDMSGNDISNVSKSPNVTNNELSKSVNIVSKETDKKNMSLNYLTSTPVQQKPLQKIAMQINTSIISPNTESKNTTKIDKTTPKKRVSNVSRNSDSSDDESDDDSREKSKMIDDEAEEASDNYESGDSRNDEERQYERDHEVLEKGETLESEQELSNDSDYEKDSFIVSSDEEDDDLLSGSGDDLSLSDNELKMTTKSKKKFDERKRKEQIKASKEMFEARHKLNESNKSKSITKKSKRQRLESSVLDSETEDEGQPKKNNRLRINSSQDASLNNSDADESIRVKKKKTKCLSESVCEENTGSNEKEITVCNQSVTEKNDPLSVVIKQEPKTPQKDFNMSTVLITDNIEQVQVDLNASVIKSNETSDPLQATLANDEDKSDSDISENMEIKKNYDSVLDNLNKSNKKQKKNKTLDTSLNFNKKTNDKVKDSIVDQLNLTQPKKSKTKKAKVVEENVITKQLKSSKNNEISVMTAKNDEGDISDSIDMRLLFPEDSNDSEANASKFQPDEKQDVEPADEFIPLKRTEAKTNILENMELNVSKDDSQINLSKKKNKNRKSSQSTSATANEPDDTNISFFIDTKGSYEEMDTSTQSSAKKNKKKHKQNLSHDDKQNDVELNETIAEMAETKETPANDSQNSDKKKKKKNKSLDVSQTVSEETVGNVSLMSDKKKNKINKSLDVSQTANNTGSEKAQVDVSMTSDKKKKKNKSLDISQIVDNTGCDEKLVDISVASDKKKKKNKPLDVIVDNTAFEETLSNVTPKSDKKKKKKKNKLLDVSETAVNTGEERDEAPMEFNRSDISETPVNVSLNSDKKKKKKNKSPNDSQSVDNAASEETPANLLKSDKKKKKKNKSPNVSQTIDNAEESDEAPMEVSFKSEKKSDIPDPVAVDNALTDSKKKYKKKKKKNKNSGQPQTDMNAVNTQEGEISSKKRKLDMATVPSNHAVDDEMKIPNNQKNKKRKISPNDDGDIAAPAEEVIMNKSKKRKATEDDNRPKKSKVFKENVFDKIHVPRLPETIVNQLEDKPTKESKKQKKKAIATVPFKVEEAKNRKNKPSNYLEQSIYLNDDSPAKQKQKASIKNPKVLPFIPTAITSGKGYTSNFKINVLPEETQFVAQANDLTNFKNEYLSNQRIKKLRTFERFKKQRSHKLSKF